MIIFIHHQVVEREKRKNNNLTKLNYYNIHSTTSPRKSTKWGLTKYIITQAIVDHKFPTTLFNQYARQCKVELNAAVVYYINIILSDTIS